MPEFDEEQPVRIWQIPIAQIERVVAAQLGPGRFRSRDRGTCFSRQISMYLARHVGGWTMAKIGRFYNGRHHTTVLHSISKIERLRKEDAAVDALLEVLTGTLAQEAPAPVKEPKSLNWTKSFVDLVADRIVEQLNARKLEGTKA
jgi:hypothetical protein